MSVFILFGSILMLMVFMSLSLTRQRCHKKSSCKGVAGLRGSSCRLQVSGCKLLTEVCAAGKGLLQAVEELGFVHLPDDRAAVDERENEQADAGEVLHAQESLFAELAVAERNDPAQAEKPQAGAEGDARDA